MSTSTNPGFAGATIPCPPPTDARSQHALHANAAEREAVARVLAEAPEPVTPNGRAALTAVLFEGR